MSEQDLVDFLLPFYERQFKAGVARRVRVLWLRCMEGRTYREIGAVVGVSAGRAHQLSEHTIRKLRRASERGSFADPGFRMRLRQSLPPQIDAVVFGTALST